MLESIVQITNMTQATTPEVGMVRVSPVWNLHVERKSTGVRYRPEDSPFSTLFVDVTHRCNMACRNCYIPNRDVPDMPLEFLTDVLARLPQRTRVRLVGAEPTLRADLPDLIRKTRELGHIPVVLSNGLRLVNKRYVESLRRAGLRTIYLSMNGGLSDDLYEQIDDLACAAPKIKALKQLNAARFNVTVGMILVRDVNLEHCATFLEHLNTIPAVNEIHLRSVGAFGRHMDTNPLTVDEMIAAATGNGKHAHQIQGRAERTAQLMVLGHRVEITQWPELGSRRRGRLDPDGFIEPCFEHLIANEGGY